MTSGSNNVGTVAPLGFEGWTPNEILAIARGAKAELSKDKPWRDRIDASAAFLDASWRRGDMVYGVNTGYGESCSVNTPKQLIEAMPAQLTRFHGCGLGRMFDRETARAIVAVRLAAFSRGVSGVRWSILEGLANLLNHDIVPLIPQEGSVGASGDLTPLSYVAAVLQGERAVRYRGEKMEAAEALSNAGLEPIQLKPKEALALMNGTSAMTGIACFALERARYLGQLSSRITSLGVEAIGGNVQHFDPHLHAQKPHAGQVAVAQWVAQDLDYPQRKRRSYGERLQDRYSLRCAPHVIGVLLDALPWVENAIQTEINSANDNPVIDVDGERVIHGGHFYGGHIAFAMDCLKNAVANVADLIDRQVALLVDNTTNHGLPRNLTGATGDHVAINHGFKAVQIATSAWTAEALKNTMPASVFSRSTECHNQDKVSMGTISARDCVRVLELTEQVAAAGLAIACQALTLRQRLGQCEDGFTAAVEQSLAEVRETLGFVEADRALDGELRALVEVIRQQRLTLFESNE